jgi:predicted alpha/beta hydrolase family esterase
MTRQKSTILLVPGLRDHVPDHWQTYLQAERSDCRSVPPLVENKLDLGRRIAAISAALASIEGPVILVGHSAGVITIAHWARAPTRPIKAAFLAAPPDLEVPLPPGYPAIDDLRDNGWLPMPRLLLPFPTLVGISDNDPLADRARADELAGDWGGRILELGAVGHLNPASGFGRWPEANAIIDRLDTATD